MRVVFVGRHRTVWKRLGAYLLTLGVSRRVWLYRINKEVDGHEALGVNHRANLVLLCLPVLGPTLVAAATARRVAAMVRKSPVRFGPWPGVYLPSWVPILGNLWFIAWVQDRLNRFWAHARRHPERGVDIDVGLDKDPAFLVELERARKASVQAGSRFDERREERAEVRAERAAVREAGGSTPVLWWRRPRAPPARALAVTCGRCQTRFAARQDPLADTPLVCWKCGQAEVLPGFRANPLAPPERAVVPTVKAACGACGTAFHALRNLRGPTRLRCPSCGKADELPPPSETAAAKARGRIRR